VIVQGRSGPGQIGTRVDRNQVEPWVDNRDSIGLELVGSDQSGKKATHHILDRYYIQVELDNDTVIQTSISQQSMFYL